MSFFLQTAGTILVLLSLVDIFLTVLYARSGTGLLSPHVSNGTWRLFQLLAGRDTRHRDIFLSYAGPIILLAIALVWVLLLVFGFAFIYWPTLQTGIQAAQGATETTFTNAFYFSSMSFTTLGTGDLVPKAPAIQILMVLESALGFSILTLTITYFLSVYNALQQRNTLASQLHHKTLGTGDAAEFISRLVGGNESGQELSQLAGNVVDMLESQKFYPVLHFFHFRETRYAIPRMALIAMDTVSLSRTVLDPEAYPSLTRSSGVGQLWSAGMNLLIHISRAFPLGGKPKEQPPQPPELEQWHARYSAVRRRLEQEGIAVHPDVEGSMAHYVRLRKHWQPFLVLLSRCMRYSLEEIVPEEVLEPEKTRFPL